MLLRVFWSRSRNSDTTEFHVRVIYPFHGVRDVVVHVTCRNVYVVIPHPQTNVSLVSVMNHRCPAIA
jgi:hypothetical protein